MATHTREDIQTAVVSTIQDVVRDFDLELEGPIGGDTSLVADLGFASVDVIQLVVALEERFQRGRLGFDRLLMRDGRYVSDLRVEQLVSFLETRLNEEGA